LVTSSRYRRRMLNEWSDRDSEPPLPPRWKAAQYAGLLVLAGLIGWALLRTILKILAEL